MLYINNVIICTLQILWYSSMHLRSVKILTTLCHFVIYVSEICKKNNKYLNKIRKIITNFKMIINIVLICGTLLRFILRLKFYQQFMISKQFVHKRAEYNFLHYNFYIINLYHLFKALY